jgi:hypothetical protein
MPTRVIAQINLGKCHRTNTPADSIIKHPPSGIKASIIQAQVDVSKIPGITIANIQPKIAPNPSIATPIANCGISE